MPSLDDCYLKHYHDDRPLERQQQKDVTSWRRNVRYWNDSTICSIEQICICKTSMTIAFTLVKTEQQIWQNKSFIQKVNLCKSKSPGKCCLRRVATSGVKDWCTIDLSWRVKVLKDKTLIRVTFVSDPNNYSFMCSKHKEVQLIPILIWISFLNLCERRWLPILIIFFMQN